MKKLINIKYVLLGLMLLMCLQHTFCSITIPINNKSCKYTMTIPDGWDTIPKEILTQKFGQHPVEIAIYPIQQEEYFEGNYIFISFLPTIKALNEFSFKKIVEDMTSASKQGLSSGTDTLQITYNGIESKNENGNYYISTCFSIEKDSVTLECEQNLELTKFGYITTTSYRKANGIYSLLEMSDLLSNTIEVQQEYKYEEPAPNQRFTVKKIAISLCIGLLVYAILMFFSKKKNTKK